MKVPFFVALLVTALWRPSLALDQELVDMGVRYVDEANGYVRVERQPDFDLQKAIPHFSKLDNLKILQIASCPGVTHLDGLKELAIEVFLATDCENLSDLRGLQDHPTLVSLNISGSPKLTSADGIAGLRNLESLEFAYTPHIAQIGGLRNLPKLKELLLYDCEEIGQAKDLASISRLPSLEKLHIRKAGIASLVGIGPLGKLMELSLSDSKNLTTLNGIQGFSRLKKLTVGACPLTEVSAIKSLKTLEILELNMTNLETLEGLQGLANLRVATVIQNEKLRDVRALGQLRALQQVNVDGNALVEDLDPLRQCKQLRYLKAAPDHLTVSLVSSLPSLEVVLDAPSGALLADLKKKAPGVRFLIDQEAAEFRHGRWEENKQLK